MLHAIMNEQSKSNDRVTNGQKIRLSHRSNLPLTHVSKDATRAHVYPNTTTPLTSIGQLYDNGCICVFTKTFAQVTKNKKNVLHANRNTITCLWITDLHQPTADATIKAKITKNAKPIANEILPTPSISDTVDFLHAALFI